MSLEIPVMIQHSKFPDGAKKVLAGAAEMFAAKGFAATSVRQIAEAAELSVPMVYYYFPGKDDVFRALIQVVMEHVEEAISTDFPYESPLRDKLVHLLRAQARVGLKNPKMVAMMMATMLGPQEGRPRLPIAEKHEEHIRLLEALFEDQPLAPGFTPRFMAGQFVGIKNHIMISCRALTDPELVGFHEEIHEAFSDEGIDRIVDHFLHGVFHHSGQASS